MRLRGFVARTGRASAHWLLEGLLIVISVVLGLWVSQYQQARADRELAARVLTSLQREIEHNLATIEPFEAVHRTWASRLGSADTTASTRAGVDLFSTLRPSLPSGARSPFPFLRRSAWGAALSGGTIRLIDHDVAAVLSDIYRMQEITDGAVDRLANGVLTSPAIFDPASRASAVRLLELTLIDIQSSEASLIVLYRQHLPAIRAAAGR